MDVVKKVLDLNGFSELNPPQKMAINAGLLERNNMVIAAPTASGKTLIAEIIALKTIIDGKKVVYIVPLKALASEKYNEFKKKYEPMGIRVAISIGDLDSTDTWLRNYDLIIVTSEKFDSLSRHGIDWATEIGLVIADEVHLIDSPERGPTLEIVLTRIRQVANPVILALSATISNHEEIAEWLTAKPIKSDYRPVKLKKGICVGNEIEFFPSGTMSLDPGKPSLISIVNNALGKKKQTIIFVSTRKSTESTAEKIGKMVKNNLFHENEKGLEKLSEQILNSLENPTKQCKKLSECIKLGTAFHHAGLTSKQRTLIEDAFRDGLIKVITATPTLAFGLNLPAWTVVIRDLKRYSSFKGMDYLPVLEVQQMCGRSGRPKFDTEGFAILLTKTRAEAEYAWENYIIGEPEKIYSKLGVEPVLRTHVLALITTGFAKTKQELFKFFEKTFYAFQYKDTTKLFANLEKVITLLKSFGFIATENGNNDNINEFKRASSLIENVILTPTKIGKRVSELYIDPLSANQIITSLKVLTERQKDRIPETSILHILSETLEMRPLRNIRKKDLEYINEVMLAEETNFISKPPNEWDYRYEEFLGIVKTICFFKSWIEEYGEDNILENFGITPGELRARLEISNWLLYAIGELALLLNYMSILRDIKKLRIRFKYGIREELLPFVKLKGIGRVKSRLIFNSNIKTIADLRKIPIVSLQKIVGPKTAIDIKKQLGEL